MNNVCFSEREVLKGEASFGDNDVTYLRRLLGVKQLEG
jgi:hypothetical protein